MNIFENLDQKRDFPKIWTKIEIFENFIPNSRFSKISKRNNIFENFDRTQDLKKKIPP